jgi:hypothetical protein
MPSYVVTAHRRSSVSLKVKAATKDEARSLAKALLATDEVVFNDHIILVDEPEEDWDA